MICPYCGQENPNDIDTCNFCGGSLLSSIEQPTIESQSSAPVTENVETPAESTPEPPEKDQTPSMPQASDFTTVPQPPPPSGGIYSNRVWWIVGCVVLACIVLSCAAILFAINRYTKLFSFLNPGTTSPPITSTVGVIPIAVPTISSQQIPGILFYDDFSGTAKGWDQVVETDYSTDYYQGAYRILINTNMSDSWANPKDQDFTDVSIEADATKNGGPDNNDFGLICRYQDTKHFYYAVISSDGYYGITKVTSESTQLLGRDNLVFSDVINQSLASNHIRFDCIGSILSLYVNGERLDQQSDAEYTHGNVGLIAGSYDTPGTDILFDNFGVYMP